MEPDVLRTVARVSVMWRVRIWFQLELDVMFLVRVCVRISFRLSVRIWVRFRRRTTNASPKEAQFTQLLAQSSRNCN